jgi:hypothetical protein
MEDENGTSRTKRRGWEGVGVYSQRQSRNAAIAREYDRIECSRARIGIGEEQKCREWREVPGGLEVLGSGPSSSSLNRNASTHAHTRGIHICVSGSGKWSKEQEQRLQGAAGQVSF